jgi:hypothetical protein
MLETTYEFNMLYVPCACPWHKSWRAGSKRQIDHFALQIYFGSFTVLTLIEIKGAKLENEKKSEDRDRILRHYKK